LLELLVLRAKLYYFIAVGFTGRVSVQPLLAGLQKGLAPLVVNTRGYAFSAADLCYAVFTFQTFQYYTDFLFRVEFTAGFSLDLSDYRLNFP
jgi:hypothetical protein